MALKSTFGLAVVNHNYTEEERQVLNSYQSLEFMPPHSKVYHKKIKYFCQEANWGMGVAKGGLRPSPKYLDSIKTPQPGGKLMIC